MDCNPEGHSLAVSAIQLRKQAGGVASTKLANKEKSIKYLMVNYLFVFGVYSLTQMTKMANKRQRLIKIRDE